MGKHDTYLEHLSKVPMFAACSRKELQQVGRTAEDVTFKAGTELITEGKVGREFFVIFDGKARVSRNGKDIATLGPGDYFGELALLDRAVRNATVTAMTDMEALVLEERAFRGMLQEIPTMTTKLMVGMARRLHDLDSRT
jgi:CRP/FNR family cyclic AMP-dependent transcriptional regulator